MSDPGTSDTFDRLGKVAAGTAGAGVGGVFVYKLFDDLGVKELMSAGTTYGLTVLAFVAVIVLMAGYAALPQSQLEMIRGTLRGMLVVLVCLATGGMIFQMWIDSKNPAVALNVDFWPVLSHVNSSNHFQDPTYALSAQLQSPQGENLSLSDGQVTQPVFVRNDQRITIHMDSLQDLISKLKVQSAANALCPGNTCAAPAGGAAPQVAAP